MRVNINIGNKSRKEDDLDTTISPEVKEKYYKKCEEMGLKVKEIKNEPIVYTGIRAEKA